VDLDIIELSRLQFAMTVLFHFIFVPLTIGLSIIVAIMETVYVMTNRPIWRQMTKFWGTLFGINFAIGVGTGITMEFQFGMNWAYYSQYVGDIFGAPLAIEGLMAFFLEATFVGLFFFGWDKLSKVKHLMVAWLVAIGSNFSALWILIANGWMQSPVGAEFNPMTMRMEMTSFFDVLFNEVAQVKFVHTVSAGYVTASVFVLGVSCWYLLRGRHVEMARRSITIASSFGLFAAVSVVVLGDESGYAAGHSQKMKLAAMEAMWETEPAPAGFTLVGWPDQESHETHFAVHIPYVMGLIGTRSLTGEIPGINDLIKEAEDHIRTGIVAYDAMIKIRSDRHNISPQVQEQFDSHKKYLGYALLLKAYVDDPREATEEQIIKASLDTVPNVWIVFWSFRIMVAVGFTLLGVLLYFFFVGSFRRGAFPRWALRMGLLVIPLPWLAAQLGWVVAEMGRQPWTVDGVLPTALSVSELSQTQLWITIVIYFLVYSVLFYFAFGLMMKYIRKGPFEEVDETNKWMANHKKRLNGNDGNNIVITPGE
jgi:cytochrome d ubiquinol oxidase subunit I